MKYAFNLVILLAITGFLGCLENVGTQDSPASQNSDKTPQKKTRPFAKQQEKKSKLQSKSGKSEKKMDDSKLETATFGAGCYWCVEAVFQRLDGVESVVSGFMGGHVENPSYEAVCSGKTGHAEVCQIKYDPSKITFTELLEVFWKTHDPTTLNRQGADEGTQYRSAVFYHNDKQKELAEKYKKKLDASGAFRAKIVTEISKADTFYSAKKYHQNFFNDNPNHGYCKRIIQPKIDKFKKVFADRLKKEDK